MVIAERTFLIDSSRERIWSLILKAVLRLMPFERMEVLSEKKFHALLRIKMGFISLPMNATIEIEDIRTPEFLVTVIKAKGMRNMVWLNMKSTFKLAEVGESKTRIVCELEEEGIAPLLRMFFLPMVKSFSGNAFKSFEERLRQWI